MNSTGVIFDQVLGRGGQGFVHDRRFVRISYDYSAYIGYMESFDLTEDANNPFRFSYTITFKSEKTVYTFRPRRIRLDNAQ